MGARRRLQSNESIDVRTVMEPANSEAILAVNEVIRLQGENLKVIADIANRLIADRVSQDPTSINFDPMTGAVVGLLSDAARAAQLVIERTMIAKGGEPHQI